MGTLRSYLVNAALYWAPLIVVASYFKGAPWWTLFPVVGVILVLAALVWLTVRLCGKHGGELGRKLTRPL